MHEHDHHLGPIRHCSSERVDFTLDHYDSSSSRKLAFAALGLFVVAVIFGAGYGARVVEERMGHDHKRTIQRERVAPTVRAP